MTKVYAIETGADGSKTVHSFTNRTSRAAWILESPHSRTDALGTSKTVLTAQYRETIVAHQEAR